jgi:hypothetical protein
MAAHHTEYHEVASAPGAWSFDLKFHTGPSFEQLHTAFVTFAGETGHPLSGFASLDGDAVTRLTLVRDPSIRYGTPAVAIAERAAAELVHANGWTGERVGQRRAGVLAGLGLREGYSPDAPVHAVAEAHWALLDHGATWTARPVRLLSARSVDVGVLWHDEPGLVVTATADLAPAVTAAAGVLGQHRFAVTDFTTRRTYAMQRTEN